MKRNPARRSALPYDLLVIVRWRMRLPCAAPQPLFSPLTPRMRRRSSRACRTTGRTGAWRGAETVSTSGARRRPSSSRTAATDGSGSYWTASWRRCTRAAVPRAARIARVRRQNYFCLLLFPLSHLAKPVLWSPVFFHAALFVGSFAKLNKFQNSKIKLCRAHPLPYPNLLFGNPSLTWTENSNHND